MHLLGGNDGDQLKLIKLQSLKRDVTTLRKMMGKSGFVDLFDAFSDKDSNDQPICCMVMELVGPSLHDYKEECRKENKHYQHLTPRSVNNRPNVRPCFHF